MDGYTLMALLLSLAVLTAYFNQRFIGLQTSCAVMAAGLLISTTLLILEYSGWHSLKPILDNALTRIDLQHFVLNGILSFLLFAGALHLDITTLHHNMKHILLLAIPGTLISTTIIGLSAWLLQPYLHLPIYTCFLFGAIISPTDPIAVLATFKQLGAPKDLNTTLAGESLLNDGIGIVIFLTILSSMHSGQWVGTIFFIKTFLREAIGGLLYGGVLGFIAQWMIKGCKEHKMILMLTVTVVAGGYSLADYWGISGPLAMVVCGLIIDWEKHQHQFSQHACAAMHGFWSTIDELLNTILFLLLGLELLAIQINFNNLILMLAFIPISLAARYLSVASALIPVRIAKKWSYSNKSLTWYGLRGGLAVALALSVPENFGRATLLTMAYGVVVFSILVQAISIQQHFQRKKQLAKTGP